MILIHKIIASGLGLGMIGKGGGSLAAAVFCFIWYFIAQNHTSPFPLLWTALFLIAIGIWSSWMVEKFWGKDNKKVVVDELAGMCISMLFIKATVASLAIGFVLFRYFDIAKPLYIRATEKLPGGYGVMMDDILAGLYTNILLHAASALVVF